MRIDPRAHIVSCAYCGLSSFVHVPNRPEPQHPPPPPGGHYGHIHLPEGAQKALRVASWVLLLVMAIPVVFIALFVIAIVFGVFRSFRSRPSPTPVATAPAPAPAPTVQIPEGPKGGPICQRAVACCKILLGDDAADNPTQVRACDALMQQSQDYCSQQLDDMRKGAATLGRTCP